MVNEDGHFFVPEMDGSGSMFGLVEVSYGDLVIDLGGVLHDGGFHVIAYTAFLCGVLFTILILPAMLITKLLRV